MEQGQLLPTGLVPIFAFWYAGSRREPMSDDDKDRATNYTAFGMPFTSDDLKRESLSPVWGYIVVGIMVVLAVLVLVVLGMK